MTEVMRVSSVSSSQQVQVLAAMKEQEVLLAEIETRLRRMVTKMLRPSLDQTNDLAMKLGDITAKVERHDAILDSTDRLRSEVQHQANITAVLQDQIYKDEGEVRTFEKETQDQLTELRTGRMEQESRLEELSTEIKRLNRDLELQWQEYRRNDDKVEDSLTKTWDGIEKCRGEANVYRQEIVERFATSERHHQELWEELFGRGKGLTKLRGDVLDLRDFVEPLTQLREDVAGLYGRTDQVEVQQRTCERLTKESQHSHKEFYEKCEKKLNSIQEKFREVANGMATHHTTILQGLRRDFLKEVETMRGLREEISVFQNATIQDNEELEKSIVAGSNRMEAIHKELLTDFDNLSKSRRQDRNAMDAEMAAMRREMNNHQEYVDGVHGGLGFLGQVLGLVLEGERIASALQVQDYADRSSDCWLAPPSEAGRRPQLPHTADMLERLPSRSADDASKCSSPATGMQNLVPIDSKRGLSKVLYNPGPVPYAGRQHDRKDLVIVHHKLLRKAQLMFHQGPQQKRAATTASSASPRPDRRRELIVPDLAKFAHLDMVSSQPSARGEITSRQSTDFNSTISGAGNTFGSSTGFRGNEPPATTASRGSARQPKKQGPVHDTEDPKSMPGSSTGHASRQRPGSQGQPQANGSRGTMFGSLGETSPPAQDLPPSLRLPSIAGGLADAAAHGPPDSAGGWKSHRSREASGAPAVAAPPAGDPGHRHTAR